MYHLSKFFNINKFVSSNCSLLCFLLWSDDVAASFLVTCNLQTGPSAPLYFSYRRGMWGFSLSLFLQMHKSGYTIFNSSLIRLQNRDENVGTGNTTLMRKKGRKKKKEKRKKKGGGIFIPARSGRYPDILGLMFLVWFLEEGGGRRRKGEKSEIKLSKSSKDKVK